MSKMPNLPLQMKSWTKCLETLIFFAILEEIVCSFLNFLFDVFWNDTYLTYSFDKISG